MSKSRWVWRSEDFHWHLAAIFGIGIDIRRVNAGYYTVFIMPLPFVVVEFDVVRLWL